MRRTSFLLLFSLLSGAALAEIKVLNHQDGDTVRYPVVLLTGEVDSGSKLSASLGSFKNSVETYRGQFKILVELRPGRNEVVLTGSGTKTFVLNYKPSTSEYKVNVVVVTGSDGDDRYDSLIPEDPQNFDEKIDTAMKLMQTFTAETMNKAGYGRRTFNLEFDERGKVKVHRVRYRMSGDILRLRDGNELWGNFYGWIEQQFPMDKNKNLVIMGFSKFNRDTRRAEGHTALGGGGMGLFSNVGTWTWPNSIQDVTRAFTDATPIDATLITDDSAYRSVKWGVAATTIGAMLHEMGHSFGLPHTGDPTSIMQRGFDWFNRMFISVEQPEKRRPDTLVFTDQQIGRFEPRAAAQLACSPWFQPDPLPFAPVPAPSVVIEDDEVVISSENGLGALVFMPSHDEVKDDGAYKAFFFEGFAANRPRTLRYKVSDLRAKNPASKKFRVLAVDAAGQITELDESKIAVVKETRLGSKGQRSR